MTRRPLLALFATAAVFTAGCSFFKRTPPPPDNTLTHEMESEFKGRWVEKRTAELVAQGQAAPAARAQAEAEFKDHYGYTSAAQK